MAEYIEREAALDIVTEWCPDDDGSVGKIGDLRDMLDELESIPAADVVEVRHGHWIECGDNQPISRDKVYCCSNCKRNKRLKHQFKPFCELCGAKIDGGTDD